MQICQDYYNSKNDLTELVYAQINAQKRNFEQNISGWVFLRNCLARFRMLACFLLASCGTLGRCSQNPWVPWNPGWKSLA